MERSKQHEENRKLQITGGSTYIVSLPKRWIIENHLKKGSSIRLREEEGGILSISPPDLKVKKETDEAFIRISPKNNSGAVIRKIVSSYLVGYHTMHIIVDKSQQLTSKQRSDIKDFARQMLVGTEMVTDTPSELTLQVLLSYPELSVESALRRMSIIASSMHKDAIVALKTFDHQLAKSVIMTDNEVDRFNLYIIRQLKMAIMNPRTIKEIGLRNARDCLGYRLVTKSAERTADHASSIAENVLSMKTHLGPEILGRIVEMSSVAIGMFESAVESLFKQDFDLAENIIEKSKDALQLKKEAVMSLQKIRADEVANVRLIIESIRRTAEYASDIAEIVLNLTVESVLE